MQIKQEYIDKSEALLLPDGCHFDEERVRFIKKMDSGDLLAVPGSGKTTALRAKLYCMAQNLPLSDEKGILAISHTNIAVEELRSKLQSHCPQLFEYPNFVGTIQDFVDTFLALPYYVQKYQHRVDMIDADRYEQACEWEMRLASMFLKSHMPYYKNIRYGFNEEGNRVLTSSINGAELSYPIADVWRRNGTVDREIENMRSTLESMKNNLLEEGVLHFDDCYYLADSYIREYPAIINILRKRFAFVFVDEAQDMQKHQLSIIDKCFDCDSVVLQRIGDPNQTIFDGFSVENSWSGRNPSFINNSLRLTTEVASIVDHLVIDRGDDGEGGARFVVNGLNVIEDAIKPHLLLYTWETKDHLKSKFREIIQRYHLHEKSDGKKYGFHIIGWNADKLNKRAYRHLEDIFPEYNRKLLRINSIPETLSETIQQEKHVGSFYESRISILESFVAVLGRASQRANDGRQYNRTKLMALINDKDEESQSLFHEELLGGTMILSSGRWSEAYTEIKRLLTKWLNDFFAVAPNEGVNRFFGDAFVQQIVEPANADEEGNEIPLTIGTVHSVKGMTHCATMYVETAYNNKYESQYITDIRTTGRRPNRTTTITSPLLKQDLEVTGKNAAMAKRMLYVGFSRPTHLLCYASEKSLWKEDMLELMENNGWVIEEVN